jgi:pimeloyl-ACP methyl ester carboxylesterase
MKFLKGTFYFFFGFFILLVFATYFVERLFFPPKEKLVEQINLNPKYKISEKAYNYNGNKVGYVEIGNDTAQRLILVHGSPGNWTNYYKVLDNYTLCDQFDIIAIDRWGYGMTDGEHGEGDLSNHANYIRELCKPSKGGRKPIVVGHSMGGPISIACGIAYSDDLSGIISVAGSFDSKQEPNEWFRGLYKVFPLNLFFNRDLKASNDELFVHRNALDDMKPNWNKITCKVTIMQGGKDNLVAPGNLEFARQQFGSKKVNYVFIPEENHFIPFGDHPESLFREIEKMSK